MILIFIVTISILVVILMLREKHPGKLPPGPVNLLVIGGMWALGLDQFKGSVRLWKKFGPIVQLNFGSYPSIMLNDHKLIKTAFNHPALQGRPDMIVWKNKFRLHKNGIIFSDGPDYTEIQKFTLKTLKEFGFGTAKMENMILDQVEKIFAAFDSKRGIESIQSTNLFNIFAGNIIWSLIFSRKIPTQSQIHELLDGFECAKNLGKLTAGIMLFPRLVKTFPRLVGWTAFEDAHTRLDAICRDVIEARKSSPCLNDSEKDFVDLFLDEINRTEDPNSVFYGEFGEFNLIAVLSDMVLAGVDTSAEAMAWAFALILNYPVIRRKLNAELERVVGTDLELIIKLEHRPRLVYLDAFIREVMRFRPIVPWGVPHKATSDITLGGYDILKGTVVYANLFAVAQDPRVWEDPSEFRPERFLTTDESGQTKLSVSEAFTPFLTGRRMCPGSNLALDEMFLILGNIFHRYDIVGEIGEKKPSLDYTTAFVMTPQPFKFIPKRKGCRTM